MWPAEHHSGHSDIPCQGFCTSRPFLSLFPNLSNSLDCLNWNTADQNSLFQNKVSCNDTRMRLFGLYHHTNTVQILTDPRYYFVPPPPPLLFFPKLRIQILPPKENYLTCYNKVFKKKTLRVLWLFGPTSSAKSEISFDLQIAFELNTCCSKTKFGLFLSSDLRSRRDQML